MGMCVFAWAKGFHGAQVHFYADPAETEYRT